ncbi:MAG: pyridoxamine 5'-phosphate oxidase family protein [Actinomycetota bacterium]
MYQIVTTNVPEQSEPAEAVRVRRVPDRASYDAASVNAILDDGLVAHVGTVRDGAPVVIPMFYVRDGDSLLLHGAPAAGAIRRGKGMDVCVSVTHLDGLVLARSAFHHSMNYRSVVVVGTAEYVTDRAEKEAALERFVEALVPGRQADLRPNTKKEIDGTGVLRLSLATSSAKVRSGAPVDDDEDYELPIWAGVLPVTTVIGSPVDDGRLLDGVEVPTNVAALTG